MMGNSIRLAAWRIEIRDEKAERDFLAGLGCENPKVSRQTARERYRSFAVLANAENDRAAVEGQDDAD